jgi:hypothetical protein
MSINLKIEPLARHREHAGKGLTVFSSAAAKSRLEQLLNDEADGTR